MLVSLRKAVSDVANAVLAADTEQERIARRQLAAVQVSTAITRQVSDKGICLTTSQVNDLIRQLKATKHVQQSQ